MQGFRMRYLVRLQDVTGIYDARPVGLLGRASALHHCGAEYATESLDPRTSAPPHNAQSLEQTVLMSSGGSQSAAESREHTEGLPSNHQQWKDAHTPKMPCSRPEYSREIYEDSDPALPHEGRSPEQRTKDAHIVKSICRIMESQVWGPNTEPLLKPYVQHLSPLVIASVILKQKNLSMAKSFFQWSGKAQRHNANVYHALLIKLGEAKLFDEMWQLLHEMRTDGCAVCGTSFSILLKAYGAAGLPHQALNSLERAWEFNVPIDTHMYTSLLGVLFKAKMVAEARLIYKRMMQEKCPFDGAVWSTFIRGFSRNGLTGDAEECWKEMSNSGCEPALIHYNAFIEGLCESNNLCRFSEAFEMFLDMKKDCTPNQATYNMLLEGLFLDKDISKAIELYDWLEGGGWVDSRSYFLLASGLRRAKQVDKLISVSEKLHAKYGIVNVWLSNALLHCLCDQSDISRAVSYFNRMLDGLTHPDVASFATMINGYCKSLMANDAKLLLSVMDDRGHKPNAYCYSPLIATFLKLGEISDGLSLFKDMLRKGLEPNAVSSDFLLRKLSDAGMVDDSLWLLTYICNGSFHIHRSTLASLMSCLKNRGQSEKAREVCETLEKQGCLVDGLPVEKALKLVK